MVKLLSMSFYYAVPFLLLFLSGFQYDNNNREVRLLTDIVPCELLTGEQVETILPGHHEGYTALSEGPFMKGVDTYQCTYTNDHSEILLVVLHIAADRENLDYIKSHASYSSSNVNIGDDGWLSSGPAELALVAAKGLKVIKLNLFSSEAEQKTDILIKLASSLLEKL